MKTTVILFISIIFLLPDVCSAQQYDERASFLWSDLSLRASLDSLMKWYTESIVYLDNDVEGRQVSASCTSCSFDEALNAVLSGTPISWIRRGNQIILRKQNAQEDQKSISLSGTVVDSVTGEWIVGASVLVLDSVNQPFRTIRRWCFTNAFGFFSLPNISVDRHILMIRAIGYEPSQTIIEIGASESVHGTYSLTQKEIVVNEVTIEGRKTTFASATGFTRSVYRPSVPTDQNQYILEGGRIYNPAHIGGALSTFSPEVLTDVQVIMGGLPPDYGGRVGSIVDLTVRDGSRQQFSSSVSLGSLGSNIAMEGPLGDKTTILVSGRRGYPDIGMHMFPRSGIEPSNLGFSELITKISHRYSGSTQFSLSGYFGDDKYQNSGSGETEHILNDFSWNNRMADLRLMSIASSSLFMHASLVYSRYGFSIEHSIVPDSLTVRKNEYNSDYFIEDWSLTAHAETYYTDDHTFRAGVELVRHTLQASINEFSSQVAPLNFTNYSTWEAAIYLQDQWKILPRFMVELGGRATSFTGNQGSFSAIDPRFSLLIHVSDQTRLYGSLSAINQFLHPYRTSGVFLLYPAIFWYPSTEKIHPSTSLNGTVGIEQSFMDDAYALSAEAYYRVINDFHEFGQDTTLSHSLTLEQLTLSGTMKTYGISCGIRKRYGSISGSIQYNLSRSFESFKELNGGEEFVPPFDRRHEIQITSNYAITETLTLSALCVAASGQSFVQTVRSTSPPNTAYALGANPSRGDKNSTYITEINSNRWPGFQRLEFNASYRFYIRNFPCQISLRLLNSYGLVDQFIWKLHRDAFHQLYWTAELRNVSLFPLYPALEIEMRL